MDRRNILRLGSIGVLSLTGCLSNDGSIRQSAQLSKSDVEACARAYVTENIMNPEAVRAREEIRWADDPQVAIVSTDRKADRVVYTVHVGWGEDYHDKEVIRIRTMDDDPLPADAPRSDEPPFENVSVLQTAFSEIGDDKWVISIEEFDEGFDDAMDALEAIFDIDESDGPFVVNHDGKPVSVEITVEPGVHQDISYHAYYHAVGGELYRAETEAEDPTDGEPLPC